MNLFEGLKEFLSFEDVARDYGIEFNRSGKAPCPFHDEKTPSFSLHRSKSFAWCFGCDTWADAIELEFKLGRHSNRWEAAKALNDRHHLGLKFDGFDKERAEEISSAYEMFEKFCADACASLMANEKVLAWLKEKKGLTVEDIKKYKIGYVGAGQLAKTLKGKQREITIKLGLVVEKDGKSYDYFRNRILFSILNRGRIVGIWGREFPEKKGGIKYLGLPCSDFVPHKPVAFVENLNCKFCVVTESISDSIAFNKVDIPSCSPIGTNISQYQSAYFEKAKAQLYFVGDPDDAGEDASYRWARKYRGYVADLGYKADSDEVLARLGAEEFKKVAEAAIKDARHYLNLVYERETVIECLKEILRLEFASDQELWLKKLAVKSGITLGALKEDLKRLKEEPKSEAQETSEPTPAEKNYSGYFPGLVDLVEDENGRLAFLVNEVDGLVVKSSTVVDGQTYYPPEVDANVRKVLRCLPRAVETMRHYKEDSDLAIFADLVAFHKLVSELPDERLYELVAAWVVHTYLMENFEYSPYIWLYAIPEKGKTRTGKGAITVACRGMHIESLRDAHLIRFASDWRATLFIDVMDLWAKAEKAGSEDFLLQRHERGAVIARVLYPERGPFKDTAFYDIFGATFIATNEGIHPALESRAILITMREAAKNFDDIPMYTARSLKERLVAFRARHMGQPLEEVEKPAKGRLGDILKPLVQVIRLIAPESEEGFIDLISDLDAERRAQKSESTEAKLISIIYSLEYAVEEGFLKSQVILDAYNEGVNERYKISDRSLGWKLKALGFTKRPTKYGKCIQYEKALIENLMASFGLRDDPASEKKRHQRHQRHSTNNDRDVGDDVPGDVSQENNKTSPKHNPESAREHWPGDIGDNGDVSPEGREGARNNNEGETGSGEPKGTEEVHSLDCECDQCCPGAHSDACDCYECCPDPEQEGDIKVRHRANGWSFESCDDFVHPSDCDCSFCSMMREKSTGREDGID